MALPIIFSRLAALRLIIMHYVAILYDNDRLFCSILAYAINVHVLDCSHHSHSFSFYHIVPTKDMPNLLISLRHAYFETPKILVLQEFVKDFSKHMGTAS